MPKDNENVRFPILDLDGPTTSEPQPYAPEQMVRCDECLRANPPTRVNCLYCAAVLPLNETTVNLQKPALRPLEKWEQGYNNILLSRSADSSFNLGDADLAEAADLLKISTTDLAGIISCGMPLPLARASTLDEASLIRRRLGRLGIETRIVADAALGLDETGPFRVRAVEIDDNGITAYQTRESPPIRVAWSAFTLFVVGRLTVKRVELREQKAARAENRILDSSEFFTDEVVVDFYTSNQPTPYRIMANSFDFSCLGSEKSLLARENIDALLNLFRKRAIRTEWDDTYDSVRKLLEVVWPSERQNEPSGWRRERPGKYSTGSITEVSNQSQFLRYSRLRYHFQTHVEEVNEEG